MRRLILITFLLLVILAGPAQAQDAVTLSDLGVSLWPEFDRPGVLVIYRGLLASDTQLPAAVEISIPATAGQPTAVAYVGEGGQRLNQAYTTRTEGDRLVVSFVLETLGFQLEYYDALSTDQAGQREYTFSYIADYDLSALNLDFQVPPTAQGFALEPPADRSVVEGDGLEYQMVEAGALVQGDEKTWTFSYLKDNEDLTQALLVPVSPTGAPPAPVEQRDNSIVLIFLVAFVGLVAVGAGAYWLGSRTQPVKEPPPPPKQYKRRGSGRGEKRPGNGEALYCHQCGTELRSDSEFCHKCGMPVRRS